MQTDEQKETIRKWIEALRSGKYNQGIGRLKQEDKYCCLGVLCDVKEVKEVPCQDNSYIQLKAFIFDDTHASTNIIPHDILHMWTGVEISANLLGILVKMNDEECSSFNEIADYIEMTYLES